MTATRTAPAPGDIRTWDYQSDCFGGQYRLVEETSPGEWIIEHLPPSDETVDAILECAADHEARGFSYLGTVDELMDEVDRRMERAGTTSRIRLVSRAAFDAHF